MEIVPIRDEAKAVASLEALSIEIIERIFFYCLTTSSFEYPNHVCWIYNNAINSLPVFELFQQTGLAYLPCIYIYIYIYIYISMPVIICQSHEKTAN